MKLITLIALSMTFTQAFADSSLAYNKKAVNCVDGNELKLTLSADRKTIKLKIRKENFGTLKVTEVLEGTQNGERYVVYKTKAGELTLADLADTFVDEYQAYFPDCE